MLTLKKIKKYYTVGDVTTKALDEISISFRDQEFVAILGQSGSGKTTCLNIIGGLDRYDSGDLFIAGKSTKNFKNTDWDAYRNNSIGFVFQSYNLIMHLSIVANVELGMTLSGVSKSEKLKRAIEVLTQVGLKEHLHKKPNQLSGGQMQRVAIARALANNPQILLCDEPTGALDSTTSIQIMDLIKEVAKDRLVIMVTHNPELAAQYADRIVSFSDGKIIDDTHPCKEDQPLDSFQLKKTSMRFITALSLSLNNLKTKKGRTFLTSFASSIGIIGIAVILSLSTGFKTQIDQYQSNALAEFPILISQSTANLNAEEIETMHDEMQNKMKGTEKFAKTDSVVLFNPDDMQIIHKNKLDQTYIDYLEKMDSSICKSIGYTRLTGMNLLREIEGNITPVSIHANTAFTQTSADSPMNMSASGISSYPKQLDSKQKSYLESNYDVLEGHYPTKAEEIVLVVDSKNRVDQNVLKNLGFNIEGKEKINFKEIVGSEIKLIHNDDYYQSTPFHTFMPNSNYEAMVHSNKTRTLTICAVVRNKPDTKTGVLAPGIAYSDSLSEMIIEDNQNSAIVKAQKDSNQNVITGEILDAANKQMFLSYLGGEGTPFMIYVYPDSFDHKDAVIDYLDAYNEGKVSDDQIIYSDLAATMSEMTAGIMDAITMVLIAFAAISLIVSLIMISIITYTSVLERTKEIGVLKALGARKKDITRVFDAETCLLGIFSGTLGVTIAYLCTFPINSIIYQATELNNCANLQLSHAILLIIISTVLTMLGGHIPARMASKKDAVEALRSE